MDSIRKLVSGKRRRYVDDGYSLDLTYIVPNRIIAMSYPSSGFESMYRNPIGKVSPHMYHYLKYHLYLQMRLNGAPGRVSSLCANLQDKFALVFLFYLYSLSPFLLSRLLSS